MAGVEERALGPREEREPGHAEPQERGASTFGPSGDALDKQASLTRRAMSLVRNIPTGGSRSSVSFSVELARDLRDHGSVSVEPPNGSIPERGSTTGWGTSWAQSADGALASGRVLTELQSIRRSQRRMEALLSSLVDETEASSPYAEESVSPTPGKASPPTAAELRSGLSDAAARPRRDTPGFQFKRKLSAAVQQLGSDRHKARSTLIRPCASIERESETLTDGEQKQDAPGDLRHFQSIMIKGFSDEELERGSGEGESDTFIAATLPLSWPSVLAARSKYEKDKNSSTLTLIKNTVWASSRMWNPDCPSTQLQASQWRRRRCTISPGSPTHMVSCFLSFIVLVYDFTVIPVLLAWDVQMNTYLTITSVMSVMFWTIDMGLNFATAFYVKGELIYSLAAIAKRYLRTWFVLDFIAVSGDWTSIILQSWASSHGGSDVGSMRIIRLVKIARLLRIIGILRMLRFMNVLREYVERQCSGYYRIGMKTVSLLLGIMLMTHSMCCAWFAIGKLGPSDTGMRWTDIFNSESAVEQEDLYQYFTSFHWAAAQMTLGATDVNSRNSFERGVNVVCMLIGLIFSCTLVSSLSATLVDFSIAHKDQTQKWAAIRKYLKENYISTTTCMLVEDQISERLQEERRGLFYEGESCMQKLLSQRLFARLRHEVFMPTINTHPLLRLWGSVHPPTMHRLAVEAFDFKGLQVGDDLFAAGSRANAAYFILHGKLEYTQRPDSSPVSEEVTTTVSEGAWLCEAALWSEWIHVGTAVAKQRSTLVLLKADELLKVSNEHAVIKTIVASYGEIFHSKIVSAVPPEAWWPNDLVVPHTSMAQIVISMPREAQVAIGWNVLHRCSSQLTGLTGWAAKALGGSLPHLEKLEEEVTLGRSVVIQVGQEVQRVTSVACVRLLDESRRVLVQIGKGEEDTDGLDPVCQLPGQKLEEEATALVKLGQVFEAKLPFMTTSQTEIEHVEKEEKQELSRVFFLKTTYFRTIITACFTGTWEVESVPVAITHDPQSSQDSSIKDLRVSQHTHSSFKAGLSTSDAGLLEGLLLNKVYHVVDSRGVSGLYVWLPEEVFEELHTHATGQHVVAEWINRLSLGFTVRNSRLSTYGMRQSRFSRRNSHTSAVSGMNSWPADTDQEMAPPMRTSRVSRRSTGQSTRQLNGHSRLSACSSGLSVMDTTASNGYLFDVNEVDEGPDSNPCFEMPSDLVTL